MIKIVYAARSFLDYRIPVFVELDKLCAGGLHVVYSGEVTPERVQRKIGSVLGKRSLALYGEKRIGPKVVSDYANTILRIPYQPGLYGAIKGFRPDVVVGDGFFQWSVGAYLSKLLLRTPVVLCYERTFHTERSAQWYRTAFRRTIARYVDAMACNGKLSMEYARWLGMPESRITLGHMVADTDGIRKQTALVDDARKTQMRKAWSAKGVVFIFVGRLIQLKGLYELLAGWKRFRESHSAPATLVIVGDGPEKNGLQSVVAQDRLTDVVFTGAVDYDRLGVYYAAADAFVIPTLEDNWSLVVPEAMAAGLPILCSQYNGCWPELVRPENGWIFDPLLPSSVCTALAACANAADLLAEMGQKSRNLLAGHTPETAARAIFGACMAALNQG